MNVYMEERVVMALEDIVKELRRMQEPTAEIVRCKDCKHWADAEDYDCEIHSGAFGANDYCSYGERKEL